LDGDLKPVIAAVNAWAECPIYHGETNSIRKFYQIPEAERPAPPSCVFFATHEPCALCLSAFSWTEFKFIVHLFTYEESDEMLGDTGNIEMLQEVFRVPVAGETSEKFATRALYNRQNKFFSIKSMEEVLNEVTDEAERTRLSEEVQQVRKIYDEFRTPNA